MAKKRKKTRIPICNKAKLTEDIGDRADREEDDATRKEGEKNQTC
jgi:hypothetical protein